MPFTMSYGVTPAPAAKPAPPAAKKPAAPRAARATAQSKAEALFGPKTERPADAVTDDTVTEDPKA